jgi:hypothetical protein
VIEAAACADQTDSVNTSQRISALNRRCTLFALMAMTLAIAVGLLAWGPVLLQANAHHYADTRSLASVVNGINAAFCLPMLLAGVWGWRALGRSHWPATLQRPWRWCFVCVGASAILAAIYHLAPGDTGYLAAQATAAGAFTLLLCGFLAERVDARFGSRATCAAALGMAGLAAGFAAVGSAADVRALLLLQLMPVLLIPAGALSLPGRHTHKADWLLILGLYALARVSDLGDAAVLRFTLGAFSGHALMHLCLAGVAAWLAYRASAAGSPAAAENAGLAQATTSLSTSG